MQEVEIKLWAAGPVAELRRRVKQLGFATTARRVFEQNVILDTVKLGLRKKGEMIRLRTAGRRNVLTFKGLPVPGPHKSREELECDLDDAAQMQVILERLGYQPQFRYEKYRQEFERRSKPGTVTIDETPIGNFLELEGPPKWIDKTARELGFSRADYIAQSYSSLYLAWCREQGIAPSNMVFSTQKLPVRQTRKKLIADRLVPKS